MKDFFQQSIKTMLGDSQSELLDDPYYLNVEKRIQKSSLVIALLILAGSLYWGSAKFIASFILGSLLSLLNFLWMKQGVDRMLQGFQNQLDIKKPGKGVLFKYFIRYALIGGGLYAIFRYQCFEARAAVLGLFLVVIAVIYECFYQVIKSLFEDRTRGRA